LKVDTTKVFGRGFLELFTLFNAATGTIFQKYNEVHFNRYMLAEQKIANYC
jgi:hypothetical protein